MSAYEAARTTIGIGADDYAPDLRMDFMTSKTERDLPKDALKDHVKHIQVSMLLHHKNALSSSGHVLSALDLQSGLDDFQR